MKKEMLAGKTVVASVSGGKDSAAMSLWLTEQGIEHRRVFMDTGWEHADTYEYLRGELARAIGPIEEIRGSLGMIDLIRKKQMFPSGRIRFCTQELKVFPIQRYLMAMIDAGESPINTIGMRASESAARATLPEWDGYRIDPGHYYDIWRPLINWSEQHVIAIHKKHGLRPNPLYLRGASRVGCWPCIHSRKAEIRLVAESDPARIDEIRELENEIGEAARMRYAERGETFASLGFHRPTWFRAPSGSGDWTIDRAVEWSRTSRGGLQMEMFADYPADDGCVRWGLCETEKK